MIGVVDFGAGNTRSVLRALAAVGADARLVATPEGLGASDRLVLPGVGAAPSAVDALTARGLWEPLRRWGTDGRPLLGVCLGAQLLLSGSDEGDAPGLGLIEGRCLAFPTPADGGPQLVPHIGWNAVATRAGATFDAYFVHGYWTDASEAAVRGWTTVDGFCFPSVVRVGSVSGVQFHPEKSGPTGRALLAAFAQGRLDAAPGVAPEAVRAWS
ncbi:MAG TPA: imidazole glycerol phosphate synthase subunit HisH [Candidatus Limnocylindria bacterium]|nr:imidazole glycerol phosphate synthase subunit HisH [Candidatus Limnocylindria bacterium]